MINWSLLILFFDLNVKVVIDIINDLWRLFDWRVFIVPILFECCFIEIWFIRILITFALFLLLPGSSFSILLLLECLFLFNKSSLVPLFSFYLTLDGILSELSFLLLAFLSVGDVLDSELECHHEPSEDFTQNHRVLIDIILIYFVDI